MVWESMGWNGVGKLIEVQGIMDGEQYCEILVLKSNLVTITVR